MASRRWLRGQSDVTVSLSAPRPLTTLGASRSTGPFDEVRRVYGDFATALGAGPLPVMGDAIPPREHIGAAHDALKTSRTVGTMWARDPNLKIKDQAARC